MSFKVGDVVEVIGNVGWTSNTCAYMIGLETTIIGTPRFVDGGTETFLRWPVHDPIHPNTGPFWARPENLRLKRPPSTDDFTAGDWELCPWKPKHLERA